MASLMASLMASDCLSHGLGLPLLWPRTASLRRFTYYTTQELPYAHYAVGVNDLDDFGEDGVKFTMMPRNYEGSVSLGLQYDDQLYEEDCVRYLRGEPITTHLVDRELAARLDAENGPWKVPVLSDTS